MKIRYIGSRVKIALIICLILILGSGIPSAWATQDTSTLDVSSGDPLGGPPPSHIPGSSSEFRYVSSQDDTLSLGTESIVFSNSISRTVSIGNAGGGGGGGGDRLGNAPDALFRVLESFLARGRAPPPEFPVPYVIYTLSDGGVEKFTDVLTKMPIMIDVDANMATGQGGKDVRVLTTIEVNPLRISSVVERLGAPNPSSLEILVTFPAFFYNGEAGAPDGEPYWQFGYETQPGFEIPQDIAMTFTVDDSVGSDHTYDFDWSSSSGIPSLGFVFGTFQVLAGDITMPKMPAFANFVVSSPPFASLTFDTTETDTLTRKCMNWAAPSSFFLQFDFAELDELLGVNVEYPMIVTVDRVPQTLSLCTEEDRAAGTYSVDYMASSPVDLLELTTEIVVDGTDAVDINLGIEDMPGEMHVDLSDGSLMVDVSANVGTARLDAAADAGLAGIDSLRNLRLRLADIPDLTATWSLNSLSFGLDAPSCLGRMEFAFSDGTLVLPAEHDDAPESHYLFAQSIPDQTGLAVRVHQVSHIAFEQDNSQAFNSLDVNLCDRRVLYVIAETEDMSLLTPEHNANLRVVVDTVPTDFSLIWTVPFTLNLETNAAITSMTGDLILEKPGNTLDLTAHAEILDIPADMSWNINPGGSITFNADASIGTLELTASDPNGLANAGSFFSGQPVRLFAGTMHNVPSFTANWSTETTTPQTSIAFNTLAGAGLGDLTFGITTSETTFVTLVAPGVENRGIWYNDDTRDLGSGLVIEASLRIHVEDMSSVDLDWHGSTPTVHVGFGSTAANELRVAVALDGASQLNPAAPRPLSGTVSTTSIPTTMDVTVTPNSFDYTASGQLDQAMLDINIGEPPDLDVDQIHGVIEGIPTAITAAWTTGSFSASLSNPLDRALVMINNPEGIFSTDLQHVEINALRVPEAVSATWSVASRVATLNFLDNTYDQGLGEFRFLATTGEELPTTDYVNDLGVSLLCMTDYGAFTQDIDSGYWPATVPTRLDVLHCRHPTLDTGVDDYMVYRTGSDFDFYAGRLREVGLIAADLKNPGFADVEFSRNLPLARQLYLVSDNVAEDRMTVAEVSTLPDGLPTNSLHAEWNSETRHYAYTLSESIPFIDVYDGDHATTSLSSEYTKLVFQDVPISVSIDYTFARRNAVFDFVASAPWQLGYLSQDGSDRLVAWLQMQSLHFDYALKLPGEESCSLGGYDIGICYRLLRFSTLLDAIGAFADGILGIYNLKSGLDSLSSGVSPRGTEYIPDWTFILNDFDFLDFDFIWDLKAGFTLGDVDVCIDIFPPDTCLSVDVDPPGFFIDALPSLSLDTAFSLIADFWWNTQLSLSLSTPTIPILPGCVGAKLTGSLTANSVKDYVNQDPIHILGPINRFPFSFGFDWDFDWPASFDDPCEDISIVAGLTGDVVGLHHNSDHPSVFG